MDEKIDLGFTSLTSVDVRGALVEVERREAGISQAFANNVGLEDDAEVFVFGLRPSTQALDAYGTRMSADAIWRYAEDAIAGTPLMNSHRTGGFVTEAELPLGYSFHAKVEGKKVSEKPLLRRRPVPGPKDVDLMELGLQLRSFDYMVPNYFPNGQSQMGTNDVIAGISSRSIRSVSIGFGHALPGQLVYICGLCGEPMGQGYRRDDEDATCKHIPLVADRDTGLLGFAWVVNSVMYEHSLVWAGATPGAIVEGARMAAAHGDLRNEEVDMLEHVWAVRLMPASVHAAIDMDAIAKRGGVSMTENVEGIVVEGLPGSDADVVEVVVPVEGVLESPPVVELAAVPEGEALSVERVAAEGPPEWAQNIVDRVADVADTIGLMVRLQEVHEDAVKALVERMDKLEAGGSVTPAEEPPAEEAPVDERQVMLDALIDETVGARIRAVGATAFDLDGYRKMLAGSLLEVIQAEKEAQEKAANKALQPGRQVAGAVRRGDQRVDPRQDPALYAGV